jgi:hypothetical protein
MFRSTRILFTLILILLSINFLAAQSSSRDTTKKSDGKWDVSAKHGPTSDVEFETTEGTWIATDVSPDGKWIVFDLLGDIYLLPPRAVMRNY